MLINTTLPLNFDLTDNIFQILPINFKKRQVFKNARFSSQCISKASIVDCWKIPAQIANFNRTHWQEFTIFNKMQYALQNQKRALSYIILMSK